MVYVTKWEGKNGPSIKCKYIQDQVIKIFSLTYQLLPSECGSPFLLLMAGSIHMMRVLASCLNFISFQQRGQNGKRQFLPLNSRNISRSLTGWLTSLLPLNQCMWWEEWMFQLNNTESHSSQLILGWVKMGSLV